MKINNVEINVGDSITVYVKRGSNVIGTVEEIDETEGRVKVEVKRNSRMSSNAGLHSASGWYDVRVSAKGIPYCAEQQLLAETKENTMSMENDISVTEKMLRNGKRYSTTFLAMVAAHDWEGVEYLYPLQEHRFHGKWSGCPADTETLRNLAAAHGYTITKW